MAKATSGGRETRGKLSADERRQRWPLPPPPSPGGPPCPVTESATPMRRATRIGSCGTVRPAIGKTGGRERAWSGRGSGRESQEDLASLPSHSIGVVPVVTSVGAAGAADFTCLACPAAEAMESSFANAGVGARRRGHKTGERAAGRHRLCLCDVRLAPPAPASSFTLLSRLHSVDGAWI